MPPSYREGHFQALFLVDVGIYPRFRRGYFRVFFLKYARKFCIFSTAREISVLFRISFTCRAISKNTSDPMLVTSSRYEGGMIMLL